MDLTHVSSDELLSTVRDLVGEEREVTAKLVAYLGEVEERRLHLEAGFPSMFAFCTKELQMSENEAFRRLVAARIGRRFPVVYSLIASGAVHLSALELLRERLTEENHAELFAAVAGRSKSEIQELLAERFPKADVPTRGRIEPLSEARYKVEFTASAELREKLELCRDLMSHANPTRDLGVVVERAVDLLLGELEKKRLGRTKRARPASSRTAKRGRVSAAARRRVFERDGLQCSYVSPEGRQCNARAFLELDHIEPRALGGADNAANLRVRCRAHNQRAAEQVFGRDHMERCRHFVRTKCSGERNGNDLRDADAGAQTTPASYNGKNSRSAVERLSSALKGMGFRNREVQLAVARVVSVHEDVEGLPLAEVLREAVISATPDLSPSTQRG
jgi:5-methylcytosine-specific restriction endonuclease McrA